MALRHINDQDDVGRSNISRNESVHSLITIMSDNKNQWN